VVAQFLGGPATTDAGPDNDCVVSIHKKY
jgi:hypothetical protein